MSEVKTILGMVASHKLSAWNLVIHYMQPIIEFYQDPEVTEIMVNRYDQIFVENRSGMVKTNATFGTELNLEKLIRQLAITLGQDEPNLEILHASFPDQSRACCTTTITSPMGCSMTLRCAPKSTLSFDDLISFNSITNEMCDFIQQRVEKEDNLIISGSTGSGKTTLLRAIAEFIDPSQRVLVCEDTQELFLKLPNQILMEAPKRKDSNITLSNLIETTLRQRPDRVIVGEIRVAAACDAFLQVINTGHAGCATSIHANSPSDAIRRIQYLMAKDGLISYELAGVEILQSVNLLIQADRTPKGKKITDISVVDEKGNIKNVFYYDIELDKHIRQDFSNL